MTGADPYGRDPLHYAAGDDDVRTVRARLDGEAMRDAAGLVVLGSDGGSEVAAVPERPE